MATVVDEFVTRYLFEGDPQGLARVNRGIEGAQRKLRDLSNTAFKISGAAALPLTSIIRSAIGTDAAMRQLEARTKASADQLARFKQQAYEVGSQLPLNTADIIRAQTAFVQLGNSIDEAFAATPAIAQAAVAMEGVGIEDAARFASVALRAFSLDASEASRVLDYMTFAETKTAASARDIGNAFRFSAQAAADAKVPLHVYTSMLGVLAGSGRSAEESSQGLNVLLQKLAKGMSGFGRGGKMVKDTLEQIGLTTEDVKIAMESGEDGIINLLRTIRTATDDMPQDVLTSVLGTLVGESYASSFSFLVQNIEEVDRVSKEMLNSQGESASQAQTKMRGLSGAWEGFKAQLDTLQNILADVGISGPFEELLRAVSDSIAWLTQFNSAGELVNEGLLKLITTTLKLGAGMAVVGVGLRVVAFLMGPLAPAIRAVGLAIAFVNRIIRANPILFLISALALAVVYWDEIVAAMQWARDKFVEVLEAFGIPVTDIFAWIGEAWQGVIDELTTAYPALFTWIAAAWDTATAGWNTVLDFLGTLSDEQIFAWLGTAWESVTGAWWTVLDFLGVPREDALVWLGTAWESVTAGWRTVLDFLGIPQEDALAWLGAAWTLITAPWRTVLDFLSTGTVDFTWLGTAWETFTAPWRTVLDFLGVPQEGALAWLGIGMG